ncbi:hypothetical protein PQO03_21520 [Lentisphaera profundi]|uniref:Nucleotidyltransferase n=1 Tax=Lentisphaera profundi TaxID=1658616 RepID=A0ABY7W039_9BACT|nr:hypothetical protein [Lentisphaera profundi]WDE98396.1 hypothetical protein PQO03_21520 [Lentisphaera profundi]
MHKTLVILAAGMGSRYGGLKQLDQLGPSGEAILEYSVFDALRAGFNKIIFIIRRDFAKEFKELIGPKFNDLAEIVYCYQELDHLPTGFDCPSDREKPWGTGHALLSTIDNVNHPFLIINADDFYGLESFKLASNMIDSWEDDSSTKCGIVTFELAQTLSQNGTVSRGVCQKSKANTLSDITETHGLALKADDILDDQGNKFASTTPVSMNMWCMSASMLPYYESAFIKFLSTHLNTPKSEFYIPSVIDELIKNKTISCDIVESPCKWFGVTYKEDKQDVIDALQEAVDQCIYPPSLHI